MAYCDKVKELTEAEARAIQERYERNVDRARTITGGFKLHLADVLKGVRKMALARMRPLYDEIRKKHQFECVICGAPMKAKRSSKTTCSARCRTRLTRFRRAGRERELVQRLERKLAERGLLLSQMPDHCGRDAPLNWVIVEDKRKVGKRGRRIGKIGPTGKIIAHDRKLERLERWAEKELRG